MGSLKKASGHSWGWIWVRWHSWSSGSYGGLDEDHGGAEAGTGTETGSTTVMRRYHICQWWNTPVTTRTARMVVSTTKLFPLQSAPNCLLESTSAAHATARLLATAHSCAESKVPSTCARKNGRHWCLIAISFSISATGTYIDGADTHT